MKDKAGELGAAAADYGQYTAKQGKAVAGAAGELASGAAQKARPYRD